MRIAADKTRCMMDDFRLKVFVTAARSGSFTRCAQELFISQPAVSRHISELEGAFRVALFERRSSGLTLTAAGETLLRLAERVLEGYQTLTYEMNLLTERTRGGLRIGASTTIAQYLLPPLLARFFRRYPEVTLSMFSGNSSEVEQALLDHRIDLGLVENTGRRPELRYEPFMRDELVLVADPRRPCGRRSEVSLEELTRLPLVLREIGSGTLEVVERSLARHRMHLGSLRVVMHLGSTEAIKSFLHECDAMAIVSVIAVRESLKNGTLKVVDISGLTMEREFSFVRRPGSEGELPQRFMSFAARETAL